VADTAQVGWLCAALQAAQGTAADVAALAPQQLLHNSHSIGLSVEITDPDPEIGGGRDPRPGAATYGGAQVGGDLDAALRFDLLPLFLLAGGFVESGAPTEPEPGTGAYRHQFVFGDATYLTLMSAWGANRVVRQWQDVLVDSLTLATEADGDTTLSATVLGASEVIVAAEEVAVPTAPANDAKGAWKGSAVVFNDLGTYRWSQAQVALNNNLSSDEYVLGKATLDGMTPGERELVLSGTIRLGSDDPSVTALYRAGVFGDPDAVTSTDADPYITSGAVTFGSGRKIGTSTTQRYRSVWTMPSLTLRPFALEQSGADTLEVSVEARAYGSGVTVDVYNARAGAYTA